jgi:DNA invertase Pin-like site-specific DNA recombinase
MILKAAVYIRISTQQQYVDRQEQDLLNYAEKEGVEIRNVYKDIISGFKKNEDMPELERLKADAKKGLFNIILFSEFTRLSRTVTELNQSIDYFRDHNIDLFFQKQNIWVKKKGDLGTDILIQVLGVVASYEIELFAERSISGKLSAVRNRGIHLGGLTAYGYKSEEKTKRLVIDDNEKEVVKRIFNMYSNGYSQQEICDILNSENIESPYRKRIAESIERRKEKGFDKKEYKRFDFENLVWTASSLNKILKNRLYLGERNITLHKPDPTNPQKIPKRINREIIEQINDLDESLTIIPLELFNDVQTKLKENYLIKDTPVLHPTLLKSVLTCGCCGRNFLSAKANGTYRYMCFGKIKDNKTRAISCTDSLEIAQYKLDGLVTQIIISRLADANRTKNSSKRIEELEKQTKQQEKLLLSKEAALKKETDEWHRYFEKAIKFKLGDEIIKEREEKFSHCSQNLSQDIIKLKDELISNEKKIRSIRAMASSETKREQEETILNNKALLKQLTNEFLERVILYPIYEKYSLVIISFKDGSETWGTIKSAKYRNDEKWFDPTYCKVPHYIYQYWNNDDKSAEYFHDNKTVVYKDKSTISWISPQKIDSKKTTYEIVPVPGKNPIINMNTPAKDTTSSNLGEVAINNKYIEIEDGTYSIKDFINLLKGNNSNVNNNNGDFPPFDFHEDEEGHEVNLEKSKQYRLNNANKSNERKRELRKIRKNGK